MFYLINKYIKFLLKLRINISALFTCGADIYELQFRLLSIYQRQEKFMFAKIVFANY
jgi:hypothetical protein